MVRLMQKGNRQLRANTAKEVEALEAKGYKEIKIGSSDKIKKNGGTANE